MIQKPDLNPRLDLLTDYPFDRLRALLDGLQAPEGIEPLALSIGEPKHNPPSIIAETLTANAHLWDRYPPVDGTAEFRHAVSGWLTRRYHLADGFIDPASQVLPVSGTREALFLAAILAVNETATHRPAILFPNPLYHVYAGAAAVSGAEAIPLATSPDTGHLPDLDSIDAETLSRTALMYVCSPANPQGAAADPAYLKNAVNLARTHGFVLALDECYSEIYYANPPAGGAGVCAEISGDSDDGMANVLLFHSLSKRSSAPGLRSGFVAGCPALIRKFRLLRSYGGATMPMPIMAASAALWNDEAHVEVNRALYRTKFDIATEYLSGKYDYIRPAGGFFLWLNVAPFGGGEEAARRLWTGAGLRVLPGAYLSRPVDGSRTPGDAYIRVALVHDVETTKVALEKLVHVLR